jgi:hypothetical protein
MTNTKGGIHLTTAPDGTAPGWVNQANGVVLSRHKTKAAG